MAASKKKKKVSPRASAPKKSVKASAKKAAPTKTAAKAKSAHQRGTAKKPAAKKAAAKKSTLKSVAKKIAAVVAPAVLTAVAVKSVAAKSTSKSKSTPAAKDFRNVLTPLDDRILVKAEAASDRSAGGIIIPGTVDERPQRGHVVAVGRGRRNKKGQLRPLELSVGETVLFAESAGSKITIEGAELLIIREDEVLGVVG